MAYIIYDPSFMHTYREYENDGFPLGEDIYYMTPALSLNFFMTIVNKVQTLVPIVAEEINYNKTIQVITEYPKDLTKLKSPCIVIRHINDDDDQILQEGKVPIVYDEDESTVELDTYSMKVNFYMQFDCCGGTKLDRLMLKCIIQTCFIRMQRFPLLDFTQDLSNPVSCKMNEEIRKRGEYTCWNSTHDELNYIAIYRQNFYVKMMIVPYDEIVNLDKIFLESYSFQQEKPTAQVIVDNQTEYTEENMEVEI